MSARKAPRSASGPPWWLIILIAALLAVVAFYLWNRDRTFDSARYGGSAPSSDSTTAGSQPDVRGSGSQSGAEGSDAGPGVRGSGAGSSGAGGSGAESGIRGSGSGSGAEGSDAGPGVRGSGAGSSGAGGSGAESGIRGSGSGSGTQGSDAASSVRGGEAASSARGSGAGSGAQGSGAASSARAGEAASGAGGGDAASSVRGSGSDSAARSDDSAKGFAPGSSGAFGTRDDSRTDSEASGARAGASAAASPAPGAGAAQTTADAAGKSAPRYPLPAQVERNDAAPLPDLAHSDLPILGELLGLGDRKKLLEYGNLQDLTRRFVVTVDHLPREMIPARYSALQRIPGSLKVATEGKAIVLKPQNFERYKAFVAFAESLGSKPMVAIYLHFYPLLQQEYRAMGFPNGYFNDRVIEAIDDMLAAPEISGPIELVQPRVLYRFADPALESLSAGRKIMIRIGPDNAARLKKVLQGIRAQLVQ